jgi:hypothetical protein
MLQKSQRINVIPDETVSKPSNPSQKALRNQEMHLKLKSLIDYKP